MTSGRTRLVVTVAALGIPSGAFACEPILPLTQLMSGANAAGPWFLLQSLTWLVIAIVIKCASFVLLERRLHRTQAASLMLKANVLSTIPGLLAATLAGAATLLALPLIFGLGMLAQKRLSSLALQSQKRRFTGRGVASAFTAAFFLSVAMFYLAGGALDNDRFSAYWILKLLFATIAVSVGMMISTVLEEYAIARLACKTSGKLSFYTSVIRANYITLGLVLLVAALQILPKRLAAPHFIVSWLHNISTLLGLV